MRLGLTIAAVLLLAACAGETAMPTGAVTSQASGNVCVALYQKFDILDKMYPGEGRRYERRVAPPLVEAQAQRVRNAGCITQTADLAGMDAAGGPPVAASGPAIQPISLHAGVVTNMQDDARARSFFEAHGLNARSVGSAPLGRRIYVGPFATQGALDQARDLALRAGFIAPYPASF